MIHQQPFFELIHTSKKSGARIGRIHTAHGIIETPNFVPVATNAALKSIDSLHADSLGIDLMFCNTYHLLLHPGPDVISNCGGLHSFMNRSRPIITDSGGFQVFSLMYGGVSEELKSKGKKQQANSILKISEEGILFRSYRDGAPTMLTAESSVQAQKKFGSDIIIPLDELPPYHTSEQTLKRMLDRTNRWELRSLNEHLKDPGYQHMYGVLHGGVDRTLRKTSAQFINNHAFDGIAIGGSIGKSKDEMIELLTDIIPMLDVTRPRHLLGIGDLASIERAIPLGIDTFDSSHPTKCARHGLLFTMNGFVKIEQTKYKNHNFAPDPLCTCYTCRNHSCAYLHHLFKAHEPVAHILASIHNIHMMMQLFAQYRKNIAEDLI